MKNSLLGEKTAFLVANGFSEQDLIETQRVLQALAANTRIVSMDQGLVNSWNGEGWGLNFAADQALNTALAADYSSLVIPGGQRSVDKLKLTAHTRRFINGFLDSGKPVVVINEAVDLLVFTDLIAGRSVCAPDAYGEAILAKGGNYEVANCRVDGNLMSCVLNEDSRAEVLGAVGSFFTEQQSLIKEAVAA